MDLVRFQCGYFLQLKKYKYQLNLPKVFIWYAFNFILQAFYSIWMKPFHFLIIRSIFKPQQIRLDLFTFPVGFLPSMLCWCSQAFNGKRESPWNLISCNFWLCMHNWYYLSDNYMKEDGNMIFSIMFIPFLSISPFPSLRFIVWFSLLEKGPNRVHSDLLLSKSHSFFPFSLFLLSIPLRPRNIEVVWFIVPKNFVPKAFQENNIKSNYLKGCLSLLSMLLA